MPKPITITITFDYDAEQHGGKKPRNFLYHLLTQLNREIPIIAVEYKGKRREFTVEESLANLPLRCVDSIEEKDLPKPPKDVTIVKSNALRLKEIPTPLDF